MAGPTALPIVTFLGPYPALPVGATALDYVYTAADATNGNSFLATGHELLLVQNSGASPYTFTVTSVADTVQRTGDIGPYTVGAGLFSAYLVSAQLGWKQSDGTVHLSASNVAIKFAVVRLPSIP